MALDETLGRGVGDDARQQAHRADRVVVARDRELELIRVGVGVEDADHRDAELARLVDGEVLALRVDDPDGGRGLLQVADTTERLVQLVELALLEEKLLLREAALGGVLEVELLELLHARETLADRLEVGEESTEPALVHVGLADAGRLLGDDFLRLLLRADEQDGATVGDRLPHELVRLVDVRQRLLQVDDVDAGALGEDEALDLRVPPTGLVPEVDAAVEQLANGDDGHGRSPVLSVVSADRTVANLVPGRTPAPPRRTETWGCGCREWARVVTPTRGVPDKCISRAVSSPARRGGGLSPEDTMARSQEPRCGHSVGMHIPGRRAFALTLISMLLAPAPAVPGAAAPTTSRSSAARTEVRAAFPEGWRWPIVPARITRAYAAPAHAYGAGHRGIDLAATIGEAAVAPADGTVAYAGDVAGRGVVTIDHGDGWVTTFEPVSSPLPPGSIVGAGDPVARVATGGHAPIGTLHFGVRRDGAYINPMLLLGGVPRAVLLPCC